MKKIITLSMVLVALVVFSINTTKAQLADYSVAPNFTLKDLNGNTHDLYTYLAQGKTVYVDFSAAWCGPCWGYHNAHHMKALYEKHGPTGMPGVHANTTNDVMVFYIEGEDANTYAQLHGVSGAGALSSQGDWVTGTPYPILDTPGATMSAITAAYSIGYFPTVYMICPDKLIYEVGQVDSNALYNAKTAGCPIPTAAIDGRILTASSEGWYCGTMNNMSVKFENYSNNSTAISSATINVKDFVTGSTLTTASYSGNLPQYGVATVSIPSFTPPANYSGQIAFDVAVTGDGATTNNSIDGAISYYAPANANTNLAWSENLEGSTTAMPANFGLKVGADYGMFGLVNGANVTGFVPAAAGGTMTMIADFFNNQATAPPGVLVCGNHNSTTNDSLFFKFDCAHTFYTAATPENDKLEVVVSTDCGASWTSVWTGQGATINTAPPKASSYIPAAASEWWSYKANLTGYRNATNLLVAIRATSDFGNYAWLDNFKLATKAANGINDLTIANNISIFPNPTAGKFTINLNNIIANNAIVNVVNTLGQNVISLSNVNLNNQLELDLTNVATGTYFVQININGTIATKKVTKE
jgi:thiol-disulfide isomerase/thioredoxin